MKPHSSFFKNNITKMGREIKSKINYGNTFLEDELYSVTPHYETNILKSVMKQLDIESSVDIPKNTVLNYQMGVKVGDGSNLFNYKDENSVTQGIITDEDGWITINGDNSSGSETKYYHYYTHNLDIVIGHEYTLVLEVKNVYTTNQNVEIYASSHYQQAGQFQNTIKNFNNINNNSIYYFNVEALSDINPTFDNGLRTFIKYPAGTSGSITFRLSLLADIIETVDNFEYQPYNVYEYLNYGNYVVYSSEKQEDTNTYKIVCYDKMLYSMKDYESLGVTYPIEIRDYVSAICTKIGLNFKNYNEQFANYNKEIPNELYLDSEGNSLGYKYRDVLDELAEVTASNICINEETDELEIRYLNNTTSNNLFNYKDKKNVTAGIITDEDGWITVNGDNSSGSETKYYNYYTHDLDVVIGYKYTLVLEVKNVSTANQNVEIYVSSHYQQSGQFTAISRYFNNINNNSVYYFNVEALSDINPALDNGLRTYLRFPPGTSGSITFRLSLRKDNVNENNFYYEAYNSDTISEDFLKNEDVNFGEKIGPINTIVLSRSAGADNIYYPSTLPQNPKEIKISDNQIMNGNNRDTFMPDIYNKLNGLTYYSNDIKSTGICYYDVCDKYTITVGQKFYPCIMIADEIGINLGIEELINTEKSEENVTDYSKADKTDRRINQTYLIVDKQNNYIESVVGEQNAKISRIEQSVDGIESTVTASVGSINMINNSDFSHVDSNGNYDLDYWTPDYAYMPQTVVEIEEKTWLNFEVTTDSQFPYDNDGIRQEKIKPINAGESYTFQILYQNLPISDATRTTRITNLYLSINLYNESGSYLYAFSQTFNVGYDMEAQKFTYTFTVPSNINASYCTIRISTPGVYDINKFFKGRITNTMLEKGSIESEWRPSQVDYYNTTKVYSQIVQRVNNIEARVVDEEENIADLQLTTDGLTTTVSSKVGKNEVISKINQSSEAVTINANKIGLTANDILNLIANNQINLTSKNISIQSNNFSVDRYGNMNCTNANITGGNISMLGDSNTPTIEIHDSSGNYIEMYPINFVMYYDYFGEMVGQYLQKGGYYVENESTGQSTKVWYDGIVTPSVTQTSKEEEKKNFEKFENALDIIKNIDIYKYNLKDEKDNDKKHIGFVIGDKYKYSKEVTSKENDGVDTYSFISLCCKAIQEQQKEIEPLKEETKLLKEEIELLKEEIKLLKE